MENEKEKEKRKKRIALAAVVLFFIGVLSMIYAAISSTLNITGNQGGVDSGGVEFVQDGSFPYCIGTDYDPTTSGYGGPYYASSYTLRNDTSSPSYALANAGTVAIGRNTSAPDSKPNDLAIINGTKLFDYGVYVVYKLKLKNTSSSPMKLTHFDPSELTASITSTSEVNIKNNVGVEVYKDTALTIPLAEYNGEPAVDSPTYLTAYGTTAWYVKVFHKPPVTGVSIASGEFSFNVSPVWSTALG